MEILIAITISAILAIWINSISIIKISESQKAWIFKNKVKNNIETAVNYSLAWKAVEADLWVPKYWKIEINNYNNWDGIWNVIVSYWSWTFKTHTGLTIKPNKFYWINNITCDNLTWTNKTNESKVYLIIENWNITLSWCTDEDQKILNFNTFYKSHIKNISINSINNVINSN